MAGSEDEGVVETPKNGDDRIPETEEPMELEAAGDAQGGRRWSERGGDWRQSGGS